MVIFSPTTISCIVVGISSSERGSKLKNKFFIFDMFSLNREKWGAIRQKGMFGFVFRYFFLPFVVGMISLKVLIVIFRKLTVARSAMLLPEIIKTVKYGIVTYSIIVIPLGFLVWFATEREYGYRGENKKKELKR